MKNKKWLTSIIYKIATLSLFLPLLTLGQTIQPISPWKYETPYPRISTINTSSSLRVPSLGSTGNPCLSVDATGLISTTTCISSGGAITSLNGLTTSTQFFATSTASNQFKIVSSGNTHTLTIPSNVGFFTNDSGYLSQITTTSTLSGFTQGSVLFVSGTTIGQNNSNFFWNNANNRLALGMAGTYPNTTLEVWNSTSMDQIRLGNSATEYYKIGRSTANGFLTFTGPQATYSGYSFRTDAGERLVILNNGYVGIGTSPDPTNKFEVEDTVSPVIISKMPGNGGTSIQSILDVDNNYDRGVFAHNAKWDASTNLWNVEAIGANDAQAVLIRNNGGFYFIAHPSTGNTARTFSHTDFIAGAKMVISNTGRVGIGTTAPSTALDVWSSTSADQVRIGQSATEYYKIGRNTTSGFLTFTGPQATYSGYSFTTDSGEKVTINNSGYVGILTTSPAAPLNVIGNVHIGNSTTSGRLIQQRGSGATDLTADEVLRHGAYFGFYNNYAGVPAGSDFYGIHNQSRLIMSQSYTSYSYLGYDSQISINNNGSPFTLTNAIGLRVIATQKDNANTTITNDYSAIFNTPTLGTSRNVTLQVGNAGAPTVGNWNIYGDSTYNNYLQSSLGIGVTSITARLHLPAGTATASTAPLKFSFGTNLTTPENGAVEFDGTHLYVTDHSLRRTVARTNDSSFPSNQQIISSNGSYLIGSSNFIWDNSNLRVGLYTSTPSYNIGFGGSTARTIGVERSGTGAGVNLTLDAGGALSGGTNTNGGNLYLRSGQTTGAGTSSVYIQTQDLSSGVGSIVTASITNGGIDYAVDDVLTFVGGDNNAVATVTQIDGFDGSILAFNLDYGGTGYATGLYSMSGGSGIGAQFTVNTIAQTDDNVYNTLVRFDSDYKTLFGTSIFYLDENAASLGRKRAGVFTGTTPWDYAGTLTSLNAFTVDGIFMFRDQTNTSQRASFLMQSSRLNVDVYDDGISQYMDQLWTAKTINFKVGTAGTTNGLYVDSSGRTGVNKITPAYTLDVNGTVNVTAGGGVRWGASAYSNILNSGADQTITHSQNIVSIIDSDNNATTNYFSWGKNGTTFGGATELMRLSEDGTLSVTSFIKAGGDWRVGTQLDKNNTTFSNITNLSATLVAGKKYAFKIVLYVNADNVGGHKYDLNGGTATASNVIWQVNSISNGAVAYTITSRQVALNGSVGNAGALTVYTEITGSILVNAAGTFIPRFAQNATNGVSSVLVGSFMEIQELN